ncbi:MAG: hypothetical protein IJP49_11245 [Bacteroidales bacterium]|nr:hypothetical protein [Bacteroidales bacterium]
MRFFKVLVVLAMLVAAGACSRYSVPQKLNIFVNRTEQLCVNYQATDWQRSMNQFDKLVEEYHTSGKRYTKAERDLAAKSIGRYHALLLENGIEQSAAFLEELKEALPAYLEGFTDVLGEHAGEFEEYLENLFNTEKLEGAFSELEKKLEEIFGGLGY